MEAEGSLQCAGGLHLGNEMGVRGGTWQIGKQRNTSGSGLEVKPTLCRARVWWRETSCTVTPFQAPVKGNGWQECLAWAAEDSQASVSPSGRAWEVPSYCHVKIGRNAVRGIWCLSRAVPVWRLYEWIGKQILSSPLIFTGSWHEAAGQHIPKLQMGMETPAKAAKAQSRAWCVTHADARPSA